MTSRLIRIVNSSRWLVVSILISSCQPGQSESEFATPGTLTLTHLLAQSDTTGYQRAESSRNFSFPEDHGPHPDFRTEWWYLTGNLSTSDGREFGYQFTLFRNAIAPEAVERDSDWSTRQLYMAHFALTDVEGESFHAFERFNRGALGLAGVETRPFRAWLDDWEISGENPPPFRLRAGTESLGLEVELAAGKPVVLQGARGLSRKGRDPGNASYYYSLTRMPTVGVIHLGLETFAVQGSSWLDREWSTSALETEQVGWDWFALQLSDGRDLMLYQLRLADGSVDPLSSGSLIDRDGSTTGLSVGEFEIEVTDRWISPATRVHYPAGWRIKLPTMDIELDVHPKLSDQELSLSVLYWEGAVSVRGTSDGDLVVGDGYVELTGDGNSVGTEDKP